ncbi:DNA damage-binding protein 1a [Globisporangium polare]
MKLAKAAAQKLKGVIVEYDVLCSTLIGRSVSEQVEQQRLKLAAAAKKKQQEAESSSSFGAGFANVGNMFVSDVRSLLKDLSQDSTGKPWVVKDRLQSVLQGLPSQYLEKVTGDPDKELAAAGKSDDEIHLEKQLASASQELERMRGEKETARKEQDRSRLERVLGGGGGASSGSSSARDKYLDKINQLKAKAKSRPVDPTTLSPLDLTADNLDLTSKGLSTWLVNEGANELLSYSSTRGLFKAVIPNQAPNQNEEFAYFLKEA